PRERLGQERLADSRWADEQDIGLVELDVVLASARGINALVVVVDGDGERLLGFFLSDHVLVEDFFDFLRCGDLRDRFGDLALFILGENFVAERDALVADVDGRTGDELPNGILRLAAERATQVFVVRHRGPREQVKRASACSPIDGGCGGVAILNTPKNDGQASSSTRSCELIHKVAFRSVVASARACTITLSISPYCLASSDDMNRSRSTSRSICSTVRPVCFAMSSFILDRKYRISFAWISMSAA